MRKFDIPSLTFPMVEYGPLETPYDLAILRYKGAAALTTADALAAISSGALGPPVKARLPLIEKLHEKLIAHAAGGGSRHHLKSRIDRLKDWLAFLDREGRPLTLATAEARFIEWTDSLLHRQRVVGDINSRSAYRYATTVAALLDAALGNRGGVMRKTRIRRSKQGQAALGTEADKQNLEQTFAFGRALLDTCDGLSAETIRGPLPIRIAYRTGQIIEDWASIKNPIKVKSLADSAPDTRLRRMTLAQRAAWSDDSSLRTRQTLVNLRIESEMLVFIAQTGMNLTEVQGLRNGQFRYRSHLDGYQVHRVYKNRAQHEVEFTIYQAYRPFFERYLAWRAEMFADADDDRLFPHIHSRSDEMPLPFWRVRDQCKKLGIRFIPSRELRRTRINWMLRRSLDPALAAEMHQHTEEVLIREYQRPHLQTTLVEVTRFHAARESAIAAPGPGVCVDPSPQLLPGTPSEAPKPDCTAPAGCLFCEHQRDIDSADHVWSLACFRHMKTMELSRYRPPSKAGMPMPVETVIDRVTAKLKGFEQSNSVRALWVNEAFARVDEGKYHPKWDGYIRLLEARL